MGSKYNTNCNLLGDTTDSVEDQEGKYKLYNNCINGIISQQNEFEKNNKNKINENEDIEQKHNNNKIALKKYKNKKLTYDEELINNTKTINFLVIENRIILGVIILLIFLIYKYILK